MAQIENECRDVLKTILIRLGFGAEKKQRFLDPGSLFLLDWFLLRIAGGYAILVAYTWALTGKAMKLGIFFDPLLRWVLNLGYSTMYFDLNCFFSLYG